MTMTVIFDLDKTVVDSDHRYATKENGDIDLDHWFSKVNEWDKDGLHPLATKWRQIQERNRTVIVVCTSRCENQKPETLEFLERQGLRVNYYLSRAAGEETPDAELKVKLLRRFFSVQPSLSANHAIMFDDHKGVRDAVSEELGIICLNPKPESWKNAEVR